MVKMGSISKLVPKFKLKEAESIAPGVKIRNFLTHFVTISSKLLKFGRNGRPEIGLID